MGGMMHGTAAAQAWQGQLLALLPRGLAWPREPESVIAKVMGGCAEEFARVQGRAEALIDEADPRTAYELLPDWERVYGLPDGCVKTDGSVRERQMAVATKASALGGASIPYFTAIAATLGFSIEIEEFAAFTAESDCMQDCGDDDWAYVWQVGVQEGDDLGDYADAWLNADSNADEYVRSFGSAQLECLISRARPAHTIVLFSYPVDPEPVFWFDFLHTPGASDA
jgi:uncharacterized protein YmfQ (DUF2313 family)